MKLSHINITMPKGAEDVARSFYSGQLGLREIPKPEELRIRGGGGVWFDADGLDIHALRRRIPLRPRRLSPLRSRMFRR